MKAETLTTIKNNVRLFFKGDFIDIEETLALVQELLEDYEEVCLELNNYKFEDQYKR